MSAPDLLDRVFDVVDAARGLDDMLMTNAPRFDDAVGHLIEQCERLLRALHAPPPPLGPRIAELRAQGLRIREIARRLHVAPSTVSRSLARARRRAWEGA